MLLTRQVSMVQTAMEPKAKNTAVTRMVQSSSSNSSPCFSLILPPIALLKHGLDIQIHHSDLWLRVELFLLASVLRTPSKSRKCRKYFCTCDQAFPRILSSVTVVSHTEICKRSQEHISNYYHKLTRALKVLPINANMPITCSSLFPTSGY